MSDRGSHVGAARVPFIAEVQGGETIAEQLREESVADRAFQHSMTVRTCVNEGRETLFTNHAVLGCAERLSRRQRASDPVSQREIAPSEEAIHHIESLVTRGMLQT